MSYFQATMHKPHGMLTAYRPVAGLGRTHELLGRHTLCPHSTRSCKLQQQLYPRLVLVSACHKRLGPVYASSGKENPVNDVSNICCLSLNYTYASPILSNYHAMTVSSPLCGPYSPLVMLSKEWCCKTCNACW
jgi:hypothetical protein